MIAHAELHALVDALPEKLPEALLLRIKQVLVQAHEQVVHGSLTAKQDQELREACAALDRGEGIDGELVFAELEKLAP